MSNQKINELFNKVASFQGQLNQTDKEFREMEALVNEYSSPFHERYEIEQTAREIRNRLIDFLVAKFNKQYCRNVDISSDEIKKLLDEKDNLFFDAEFIEQHIKEISKDAIRLSLDEIYNNASKLLPTIWKNYERAKLTEADILEGRSLILRKHVSDYAYGRDHSYSLHDIKDISAFEKLIKIVLYNADPVTIEANAIFQIPTSGEEIFGVKLGSGVVEKYQLFKNSKFKVTFAKEEYAKKIADILVNGWKPELIKIKEADTNDTR